MYNAEMAQPSRLIWADIVRTLAIYLVLVVHSASLPSIITGIPIDLRLFAFSIAVTCVPLFVMLSGALLLSKSETNAVFFKKRIMRLLLPWVTWSLIYTLTDLHSHTPIGFLHEILLNAKSFWFLPMIFGLYLLTPALRTLIRTAKLRDIMLLLAIWFITVSLLPYTFNSLMFPRHVDDGIVRHVINFLGYYLLGHTLPKLKLQRTWLLSLFLVLGGMACSVIGVTQQSLSEGSFVPDFYSHVSPGVVLVSAGIFLWLSHSQNLFEKYLSSKVKQVLFAVSVSSFGIYFIHLLIQRVLINTFGKNLIIGNGPFDSYISGALLFLLSFLAIAAICRLPYLKRYVS